MTKLMASCAKKVLGNILATAPRFNSFNVFVLRKMVTKHYHYIVCKWDVLHN